MKWVQTEFTFKPPEEWKKPDTIYLMGQAITVPEQLTEEKSYWKWYDKKWKEYKDKYGKKWEKEQLEKRNSLYK